MKIKLTRTEVGDAKIGDTVDLPDGDALGLVGCGAAKTVHSDAAPAVPEAPAPPVVEPEDPAAPEDEQEAPASASEAPAEAAVCVICLAETDSPITVDGIGTCCPSCSAPPADAH